MSKSSEISEFNPMNRLFLFLKKYRKSLLGASSASIINKLFDLMPPVLTAWFIDVVSGNIPSWISKGIGITEVPSIIIFLLLLTIFIFFGESFFEWLFKRGFMRLAQRVQHDLRIQVYDHLQHRELTYFEDQRIGNLMSILNDDINQLERFLNDSFNTLLQLIVLVVVAGASLCMVNIPLGLLAMVPIPFIILGSIYYQKKVAPYYKEVREKVGGLGSRLENNISGIQVIKSFTAERFELDRVKQASENYQAANFKAIRWNAVYVPIIRMIIAIGFVGTLGLGAWWIHLGIGGLTLGALAFFAMMTQRLLWPVTRLGQVFNEYERARASARRIFALLDSDNAIPEGNEILKDQDNGTLELKNISFEYSNGTKILDGIDLLIPHGKYLGIVGMTGAGKTTLIKLLLRFYDVTQGSILINGQDVKSIKKSELRNKMALVSQEVYLFHGTIWENIAYGMVDKSLEEIIAVAKKAELHAFVDSLENKYDALIGERGIKLSGGQRQRLSLARALLKDAPILILDEATSAVDTETERSIQRNLEEIVEEKTLIVIAHRLSTVRHSDNIIVLGEGAVIESGKHEELLNKRGAYYNLWNVQIGEKL